MVDTTFKTNSHSWSQGYDAARSQVEQDKQKTGSIRQQIDAIHQQVGTGQVSASQASQIASLTTDLDTASAKFRDDSQKLTVPLSIYETPVCINHAALSAGKSASLA